MNKLNPTTQAMPSTTQKTKKACTVRSNGSANATIKKRPRVTGRPFIKMEDELLAEKIVKMKQQFDVANSRLIILADRISKHEHEAKCREHDSKLSEQLNGDNAQEAEEDEKKEEA